MSLHPMYARPRKLEQAVELLAGLNTGAVVIAGGQELMPAINSGVMMPEVYVDIGGLEELKGITFENNELFIGALSVHREVQDSDLVQQHIPLLAYSATQVGGGWQVHNRGTIGGNIVSMHPLYDIAPALLALAADVELMGENGLRRISLEDLQVDTSHGLGSDAILSRVLVCPMAGNSSWGYQKLKNSGGAYGSANAAAVLELDGEVVRSIRLVIGAASEHLIVVEQQLADCIGRPYSAGMGADIERICSAAVVQPLDDQQGDSQWRQAMAGVVARRAVEDAVARAAASETGNNGGAV